MAAPIYGGLSHDNIYNSLRPNLYLVKRFVLFVDALVALTW